VKRILNKFSLPVKEPQLAEWTKFVAKVKKPKKKIINIAIVGKYFGTGEYQLRDSYAALFDALDHAGWAQDVEVKTNWLNAEKIQKEGAEKAIGKPDGIIVPIGWGERGAEGMILAADYARKSKIPYLGLCYGMQLAVIAFARSVLGWKDANTAENDPKSKHPVIYLIPSQKEIMERRAYGGTMRLGGWEAVVKKNTKAYALYKKYGQLLNEKGLTSERHRHRYEFNNAFAEDFEKKGLTIAARSVEEGLVEIIEVPDHPFYIGTQGHPEYKSRPLKPHAIFMGFIEAASKQK
jgi:CTP synthase